MTLMKAYLLQRLTEALPLGSFPSRKPRAVCGARNRGRQTGNNGQPGLGLSVSQSRLTTNFTPSHSAIASQGHV